MKYVIMLVDYADGEPSWEQMIEEQQGEYIAGHEAFDRAFEAREGCRIIAGEALASGSDATVIHPRRGRAPEVTTGPYTESIEQIGGFYLVEVPDQQTLLELCTELPPYVLELRPVLDDPTG